MTKNDTNSFKQRQQTAFKIGHQLQTGEIGVQEAYDALIENGSNPRSIPNFLFVYLGGSDYIGSKEVEEKNRRASKMLEGLKQVSVPKDEFNYLCLNDYPEEFEKEPFTALMLKLINGRVSADEAVKGLTGLDIPEDEAREEVETALAQVRAANARSNQ